MHLAVILSFSAACSSRAVMEHQFPHDFSFSMKDDFSKLQIL